MCPFAMPAGIRLPATLQRMPILKLSFSPGADYTSLKLHFPGQAEATKQRVSNPDPEARNFGSLSFL